MYSPQRAPPRRLIIRCIECSYSSEFWRTCDSLYNVVQPAIVQLYSNVDIGFVAVSYLFLLFLFLPNWIPGNRTVYVM